VEEKKSCWFLSSVRGFSPTWLKRLLSLKAVGKKGKKPNDFWSEWQDLNLRPLRPEHK
jgi:hypothetical protein